MLEQTPDAALEKIVPPYVVTCDIEGLASQWSAERGFIPPSRQFFEKSRENLGRFMRNIFSAVEMITEELLREQVTAMANAYKLPVISLDRFYFDASTQTPYYIDLTRKINADKIAHNIGLRKRHGFDSALSQIREIPSGTYVLCDDAIWSGKTTNRFIKALKRQGVEVKAIVTGVGLQSGIQMVQAKHPTVEVKCVRAYPKLTGLAHQRDFFPGLPFSGRSINDAVENIGIPYLLPFGLPKKWALIPEEWHSRFSDFCLGQTIDLYKAIENSSGKVVYCDDLERQIFGIPNTHERLVDVLEQKRRELSPNK